MATRKRVTATRASYKPGAPSDWAGATANPSLVAQGRMLREVFVKTRNLIPPDAMCEEE